MSADPWGQLLELFEGGDVGALRSALSERPGLARAAGPSGESAVMAALYRGRRDLAEALADAKTPLDLFERVGLGDGRGVEALLDKSADALEAVSPDGFTALQLACYLARPSIADILLAHRAPVDAVATNGSALRAIHAAVAGGEYECLRMVLEAGAEVDAAQNGRITALHAAAHRGNAPMVQLLLGAGADPRRRDDQGRSAIDHGAGHPDVLALFN
ncbi:ankyrin repeat domain-containing protein [Engelhardtia mirabilis]|uniref:Ankyrin repeats (3 copies) n=1 Tax=Engelhardtia mirabilis TaxID=2528011 RepID=A0A518BG65_9BACT|nr:Ankyrin repeats (3 copies) [Planctomycetes bacterium Pla133]QDV00295.1 Ankyrin repeats (3 copies) [Planctomycetes bacterium Pla86]